MFASSKKIGPLNFFVKIEEIIYFLFVSHHLLFLVPLISPPSKQTLYLLMYIKNDSRTDGHIEL